MSAARIKEAARAWLNAACHEAEVREGITGYITRAHEQFESEVDALAARLSGLQDENRAAMESLREFNHVEGEPLSEVAAVAASSHAFLRHRAEQAESRLSGLQDTLAALSNRMRKGGRTAASWADELDAALALNADGPQTRNGANPTGVVAFPHERPTPESIGREGIVTVWASDGLYLGCMGVERWARLLAEDAAVSRSESKKEDNDG